MTNNSEFKSDFMRFLALHRQGSGAVPVGYHKIDLRGSGLFHQRGQSDLENKIAKFVLSALEDQKTYFKDQDGNPIGFPALFVRYRKQDQYMDLIIDTDFGNSSMQSAVSSIMEALGKSPQFNFPLIAEDQTDANGYQYFTFSLIQPKPISINVNNLNVIPYDRLYLAPNLVINYDTEPHLLISGGTGSGKTYALQLLLAEMIQKIQISDYKSGAVYVADPKYSDLANFARTIGATEVGQSPAQIAGILRKAVQAMNKRYQNMPKGIDALGKTALNLGYAPIFIVIDEYSALISSLNNSKNGRNIADEISNYLTEIVQKGRQADVFLVLSMQRASVDAGLNSNIRYNFSTKIILGNADATTVSMLFGSQKDYQLPRIDHIGGGYFIKNDGTIPQKFYVVSYSIENLINKLNSKKEVNYKMNTKKFRQCLIIAGSLVDRLNSEIDNSTLVNLEICLEYLCQHSPAKYQPELKKSLKLVVLGKPDLINTQRILDKIGNELVYEF